MLQIDNSELGPAEINHFTGDEKKNREKERGFANGTNVSIILHKM